MRLRRDRAPDELRFNSSFSRGSDSRIVAQGGRFEAPDAQERARITRHRREAERSGRWAQGTPSLRCPDQTRAYEY